LSEELSNAAAERACIAAVFRHGIEAFLDVDDLLTDRSFTVDSNRAAYRCLRHIFGEDPEAHPDLPLVLSAAATLGLGPFYEDPEEVKHLRALTNFPVELRNVRRQAATVRRLEIARAGLVVADHIKEGLSKVTGEETDAAILSLMEKPVFDFADRLKQVDGEDPVPLGLDMEPWLETLAANPVEMVGLPSGYRRLDEALGGGFRRGSITLFAARPGMGKSHIGMNMAVRQACGAGYEWPLFDVAPRVPTLYLDTELGHEDHRLRNLANLSGVPIKAIETGAFGADLKFGPAARAAARRLAGVPYEFKSIAGQRFEDTLSLMRRWVQRRVGFNPDGTAKDCLIVFDYVKLMDAGALSKQLQEFQALGFLMTGLHNFAVRYSLPVLAFAQLNRVGIDKEETDGLAGSDRLLHLTSNLVFHKLQSKEERTAQPRGERYDYKWVVLKKRRGAGLPEGVYINVRADLSCGQVEEGPLSTELSAADPKKGFEITDEGGDASIAF
jgi:replicative DNA helicase